MRTWMLLALWLTGSAVGGGREPVNPTPSAVLGDGNLLSVAYSPDGRWLATGGGRVMLRDARTRAVTRVFDNTGCAATRLGFSPDGEVLGAACGAAGEFRFWRVDTGAQVTSVRRANALAWNFAFLPGAQDFVGAFSQPQLVRGTLGSDAFRRVGAVHPPGINAVATGPGVLVSTGEDGRVLVSPQPALAPVRELRPAGFDNPVRLAVNPQGTVLAVGDVRGTVDLYRLRDLGRITRLPGGGKRPPPVFAFSPDGRTLAAETGGVLFLVDAETGAARRRAEVGFVEDLAWAPDGETLVLAGPQGTLRELNARTLTTRFENALTRRLETDFSRLAVTRSGELLSGTLDGHLLAWDLSRTPPALVRRVPIPSGNLPGERPVVAAAAGDLALVVAPGTGRGLSASLYDARSGTLGPVLGSVGGPEAAAFSPDGRGVALGIGRNVEVRGVPGGRLQTHLIARGEGGVSHVAFFPDGRRVALIVSAYEVPTLEVWDVGENALLGSVGLRRGLNDLAVSPDGRRVVTVGVDGHARMWDARLRALGYVRAHGRPGRPESANTVAFSPDGQRFATGGHDSTIRVWRTADLRPLGVLRGHACFVLDLVWFAPHQLASGACDGTRRVWTVH
ncbi:WD40 repeat domain-containing protein [Deinococcus aestuarii]|uniref:WD40 repeat domain-containing protein n=1 Tax=Deinococcus aestuarii TaxID=2774531 RepID=UPI001C0C73B0|nr:WD40 repeat domain-containing protein [Deinococcus aestuarii]